MSTLVEISTAKSTDTPNWVRNAETLWTHRKKLIRTATAGLILGIAIALLLPKKYESTARLMPPDRPGNPGALLAMMAGRTGTLSGLAGGLLGGRTTGALFIDLLRSRTMSDQIIDRFQLQSVYKTRLRISAVKRLAKLTEVSEDKKSGAISITVTDRDPQRARDIAQAYVEELNKAVTTSNTSSARREREFIERRLVDVRSELDTAQRALSEFSSRNATLDVKEQTHAMVDAASKLQAQLVFNESELQGLEQIYGDANARVRAARARIAEIKKELATMTGAREGDGSSPYPSLRQMPHLAVDYVDLYRQVKIHETVFELLSQQYELTRIEEAKDTPVVSVIDRPLVAEKKSFPPRMLVVFAVTCVLLVLQCVWLLSHSLWTALPDDDSRKLLWSKVTGSLKGEQRSEAIL